MATRAIQIGFLLAGLNDPDTNLPLNGGSVEFYEVGTSTPKNVWTEAAKTNAFTSYTLDTNGVAQLYGDGSYKMLVKDSTGALEYTFPEVKLSAADYNTRTVTSAAVTVTPDDDIILCNTGSNDITLNFEDVANFTRPVTVKKISASNTVTLDAYSTQTFDGSTTLAMTINNHSVTVVPDTSAGTWRKSNHLSESLLGLTATADEINQVCDGYVRGGNATGDILTTDSTQTVSGKSFSQDGGITITDTGSTNDERPLPVLTPNLADTGSAYIFLGSALTNYNSALLSFYKSSLGSQNNLASLGLYGLTAALSINGYNNIGIGTAPEGSGGAKVKIGGEVEATALDINGNGDISGTAEIHDTLTLSKASGNGISVTAKAVTGTLQVGSSESGLENLGTTIPRQKVVEIGDWDMDSDQDKTVAHGLTEQKIIGVRGFVRNDNHNQEVPLCPNYPAATAEIPGSIRYVVGAYVYLQRFTGGFFDSTDFDSTSYNRGWLIIDYID